MKSSARLRLDDKPVPRHRFWVRAHRVTAKALACTLGACLGACSGGPRAGADDVARAEIGQTRQAYINGEDDRREYFELGDDHLRYGLEHFTGALTSSSLSTLLVRGDTRRIQTWGEANGLCNGEPFADQPSAVFCSGVLVDWDLVLTSGHCVDVVPLSSLRVVFDYYYRAPGELAVSESSIYGVREVIASTHDGAFDADRLDYGWLRLSEPVRSPYHPVATYSMQSGVELADPIINISAGGGVPLKLDAGGHIQNERTDSFDYFVADTDTSQGSSGSGAFDADLALVGTLARGATDFTPTGDGCLTTDRGLDPSEAIEEYTYVHRAVEALCDTGADSVLCDLDCEQPCNAADAPRPEVRDEGGCTLGSGAPPSQPLGGPVLAGSAVLVAALALLARRRQPF
jgi:hypothetical protein